MRLQRNPAKAKGFSLVEVVIAIGIVAILLTTFMAVFGPAQKNIAKALGVADVSRLTSSLENEMNYLREGEETIYKNSAGDATAFEKAFQWVKDSGSESSAIVVYQYQADPTASANSDGSMPAANSSDKTKVPGVDYITQTSARRVDNDFIKSELTPGVVVGSVYAVRMTQLVEDETSGELKTGELGKIVNLDGSAANDSTNFTEGHLAFQAEFFLLPNNLSGFVTGGKWNFNKLGAPIVTQNIAVRR